MEESRIMKRYILAILCLACAVSIVPSQLLAACVNPPPSLVSWWPAEGNGDDVTGNNPATVGGGVGFSRGEVGQAFSFAGTGVGSVAASPRLNFGLSNGFSIECWIGPKDLSIRGPLVEWRNGSSNGVLFSVSDSLC